MESSKGLRELTDIYLNEISADTALAASKKADVERGKAAAGGDREKAKAKAAQASRLYKASAEKRKKEPVAIPDRSYPKGKGASYREEVAALRGLVEKKKESYKTVAAVIDYDRSKKGTDDADYDTEHGEDEKAKKERDYAAWEREKMKKDDPNWKHKKYSTSESVGSAVDKTLSAVGDVAKVGAKAAVGTAKGAAGAVKIAGKVVKGVGSAAGRIAGTPAGVVKAVKKGYKAGTASEGYEADEILCNLVESGKFTMEEVANIVGIEIDEAQTAYEKARKAAARRAADRNAARRRGEMGGRMERETYTNEAGKEMHYKGYSA